MFQPPIPTVDATAVFEVLCGKAKTRPSTRPKGNARDFQCSRSQSEVAVALEIEAEHRRFEPNLRRGILL